MTGDRLMELVLLQERIGYEWRDIELLELALTHTSWANPNRVRSNETLELLGDSVLDLVVAMHLMERHPDQDEGFISQRREKVANTYALADAAGRLGLMEHLRVGNRCEYLRAVHRVCACTFEAVVGAAFKDHGLPAAHRIILQAGLL